MNNLKITMFYNVYWNKNKNKYIYTNYLKNLYIFFSTFAQHFIIAKDKA